MAPIIERLRKLERVALAAKNYADHRRTAEQAEEDARELARALAELEADDSNALL